MIKSIGIAVMAAAAVAAAGAEEISAERIRAHVKFLASDLLEGRGVGVRGGEIATEYLAAQFALAGAKPAGENGTYFQNVPLVGVETQPSAQLAAVGKGKKTAFKWLEEFVGVSHRQQARTPLDAEAVFVGHGITAPEFKWDDYKGVDVRGKMVVLFTNEPASTDPTFFDGRALTYYGRWTYKYEEALRRGAAGAIIIHTDADGRLRVGGGAHFVGARTAVREAGAEGARAGLRGLADARGRGEAAGHGGPERGRAAEGVGRARLPADTAQHSLPGDDSEQGARDRDAERRGDGRGQRSEAEGRSRHLHRALGPPGGGRTGERRRDL